MCKVLMLTMALCIFAVRANAEDFSAARAKLAEMVAFIRIASEPCEPVLKAAEGDMWAMEALSLLVTAKPPITEAEIQAKETEVKKYRKRLGEAKWCELYVVEMNEADLVFGIATNRK